MIFSCDICQKTNISPILDLGQQPLANKYPTSSTPETEDKFSLTVLFCDNCKNVQLNTKISRERMFEDYYYLSSVNQGLVKHFENFAKELLGSRFVVDIGSNDGIFLKPLREQGTPYLGVEPSLNVSKIANDNGLETLCSFFDRETANNIVSTRGKADVIVASSVFTHLEDPHNFVEAVKDLLSENGRFIIEVEYIKNIVSTLQFERFYLDRIFYYSLSSLENLFKGHNMKLTKASIIEPHGGSLRVEICHSDSSAKQDHSIESLLKEEESFLNPEAFKNFSKNVSNEIKNLQRALEKFKASGIKIAGYGAPARLSTICNYGHIGPDLIKYTIDDSPLKVNRFTPGTHIPIVARDQLEQDTPDILLVFAYEYIDDIRTKTSNRFKYFKPIPFQEI